MKLVSMFLENGWWHSLLISGQVENNIIIIHTSQLDLLLIWPLRWVGGKERIKQRCLHEWSITQGLSHPWTLLLFIMKAQWSIKPLISLDTCKSGRQTMVKLQRICLAINFKHFPRLYKKMGLKSNKEAANTCHSSNITSVKVPGIFTGIIDCSVLHIVSLS